MNRRASTLTIVFACGLILGSVATSKLAAQFRIGKNAQLAKDNLVGCAGKEISISLNEFGPGSTLFSYKMSLKMALDSHTR